MSYSVCAARVSPHFAQKCERNQAVEYRPARWGASMSPTQVVVFLLQVLALRRLVVLTSEKPFGSLLIANPVSRVSYGNVRKSYIH